MNIYNAQHNVAYCSLQLRICIYRLPVVNKYLYIYIQYIHVLYYIYTGKDMKKEVDFFV